MRVSLLSNKIEEAFVSPYISTLGIKAYDADNLYPQNVKRIVESSPTGSTCVDRYASFIEGGGISSIAISSYIVNRRGETIDDIHAKVAKDLALFGGIALHVNYNIFGEIIELNHVPFEQVRLCEDDSAGYVSKVAVYWDWSNQKSRNGQYTTISEETIDYLPVFSSRKDVVLEQIAAVGIENYKGQILYISLEGQNVYPTPKGASVLTEMSTDKGLTNFRHRITRNGFFPGGMVFVPKGSLSPEEDSFSDFADAITRLQGDDNAGQMLAVELENMEIEPKVVTFRGENYDKALTETSQTVVERIYSAYGQDVFYSIRIGKVGFSGTMINDAEVYYARQVTKEQRMLSRAYGMIFSRWFSQTLSSAKREDISIEPLIKAIDGISDNV